MKNKFLKIEQNNHILRVTLNRPERRNALSSEICESLLALPGKIERNLDIRCVVITGEGASFCAGADLKERKFLNKTERWKYVELVDRALLGIERIPVPVIAAVNGHALGGGTELTLGCDIRLAVVHANFGLTETGIGIIPTGSIVRLLRNGYDDLNSLLTYTAAHFSAQRMAEMGFIQAVTKDIHELLEAADNLAKQIAYNAPLALRAAKRVKREISIETTQLAMAKAEDIRRSLDDTTDCMEGLLAFEQKRKPVFTGS